MNIEENVTRDLVLDGDQAETVAGGATELGDGVGAEAHNLKRKSIHASGNDEDLAVPYQMQVLRNDGF